MSAFSTQPQCFACTHPLTDASTYTFFIHPESAHLQMHTLCFGDFHIWNETQENLRRIVQAWRQVRRSRQVRHSRRASEALQIVRSWWSLRSVEWADIAWRRAICRRVWWLWRHVHIAADVVAESSDEDEGVPGLVDSSTSDAVYSSTDDSSTDNEQ